MSVLTKFRRAIDRTVSGRKGPFKPGAAAVRPSKPVVISSEGFKPAPKPPAANGPVNAPKPAEAAQPKPQNGTSPTATAVIDPDHTANGNGSLARSRNKQEVAAELQRNYEEVIGLVRKLNARMDDQERRARRLLEIAEDVPDALAVLPQIRDQAARTNQLLAELADATRNGGQRTETALKAQHALLEKAAAAARDTARAEQHLSTTLGKLEHSITGMTGTTGELGALLRESRRSEAARDAQIAALVARTRSWLIGAALMCAAGLITAGVVIALALA
jgi:hypothetical protein